VRKYDLEILNIKSLTFEDVLDFLEFWIRVDPNLYIKYGTDSTIIVQNNQDISKN
jgi:hypothetical protein